MTFKIEKVSNLIMITAAGEVFKAWDESEFTPRKLTNAKRKIESCYPAGVEFIDKR